MLITCNLLKRRVIFFSEKFHDKAIFNSLAYSNDLYNITISSQKNNEINMFNAILFLL